MVKVKRSILSYISGIIIGLIVFAILELAVYNIVNFAKQNENLEVTNRYIDFQNSIEHIIYDNITLIKGYQAYVEINQDMDQLLTENYLNHLLANKETYIRNIGIIKDTTIVWNYPVEGNEASLGIDLATVDGQKDIILKTKETLEPALQGPVNLIQGGIGFIIRLPLIREDTYWGQISLVIDGEAFYELFSESAKENNLEIAIYNNYPEEHFFATKGFSGVNALLFDFSADIIQWKIELIPIDGWKDYTSFLVIGFLISSMAGILVGFLFLRNIQSQKQTRYQANHDFLTGLYNRAFLDEYQTLIFAKAERQNAKIGFLLIDVNKFKQINDIYGHHIGDLVLKKVSKLLLSNVRSNEAVFRLGGDEFLVVFPEIISEEEIMQVRERINHSFIAPITLEGKVLNLSVSIGCSIYPKDGAQIDELLKMADKNMYKHKAQGER